MTQTLQVVTTPFGKFQIQPDDLIGMTIATGQLWDGAGFLEVIFADHYEPRTTLIDIGANIGSFSVYAAFHGATKVVAVEAIPETAQMLRSSLNLNRFCDNVVVPLEIAAFDHYTLLSIAGFDPSNLGATALRVPLWPEDKKIPAAPLDDYRWLFGDRVSLIKCDVQGCDLRALRGLVKTIKRDRPAIVFEWEAALAANLGDTWADMEALMQGLRYEIKAWPTHPNNFLALPLRTRRND